MYSRILHIAGLCTLVLVLTLAFTASAQGPFQQDTNEPCLGWNDPFCPSDTNSGGTTTNCKKCSITNNSSVTCSKDSAGRGDTCTATYDANGTITCEVSGSC
jgi:hypothetical protein